MRTRDSFGLALTTLRTALAAGLSPGQHLPVVDVAAAVKLSTSPVREALSRLCGEGLIEDRRGAGYFTRAYPTEDILGLLAVEEALVALAARIAQAGPPAGREDGAIEAWMRAVVEEAASDPLCESFERVHQRLNPLRRLHGPLEVSPEGSPVDAYYERWRAAAGVVAGRVRRLDPAPPEYTPNTV